MIKHAFSDATFHDIARALGDIGVDVMLELNPRCEHMANFIARNAARLPWEKHSCDFAHAVAFRIRLTNIDLQLTGFIIFRGRLAFFATELFRHAAATSERKCLAENKNQRYAR